MTTFGQRLRQARESSNISLTTFAEESGISISNLSRYENDSVKPTSDSIVAISNYLNVSTDWLLKGTDKPITDPDLQHMIDILEKMMSIDSDTRIWVKKQFEYCFKPLIDEILNPNNK
ncbi:Hypothetical protein LUCI_3749 [Lucifera butyrica]|uniref:HTH cro/C1-type domain-containing protein n=1 Tax=Lucifera butyrica TaxID=1351585 RepID=A0A498RC31_9FIRM|nr:helix-turn-helix transcriptional regulator [Lucifera butyrica]VBB08477.1 Hypothetical protein LUCI_3749 [Lucifera butyrica]